MIDTANLNGGLGLAAIQIGILQRVIIARKDITDNFVTMINPTITHSSPMATLSEEGCLSIPDTVISVYRPTWIDVSYETLLGEKKLETYGLLFARVICHEIDHLNGILITDH